MGAATSQHLSWWESRDPVHLPSLRQNAESTFLLPPFEGHGEEALHRVIMKQNPS